MAELLDLQAKEVEVDLLITVNNFKNGSSKFQFLQGIICLTPIYSEFGEKKN
jgi:hypothetical protein